MTEYSESLDYVELLLLNTKGFISLHTEERISTERKSYFRTHSVLQVNWVNLQLNPIGKKRDWIKTI